MIIGKFYNGSGLGNMLHRYVATRVLALDKGYDFGMIYIDDGAGKEPGFKGKSFMNIDMGAGLSGKTEFPSSMSVFNEKKVVENGVDIRSYDPEFNFIEDNTTIDGEFQDERYWEHREREVDEWLKVEPLDVPDDVCVIGFRGGEFTLYPDLFLTKSYWEEGIKIMKDINPNMRFEIHTDDPKTVWEWFMPNIAYLLPQLNVIHDIGINWRSMRYAKYAIIANSSFFILPRWLNKGLTISPRGWGRRNIQVWSLPQNYYKRFTYI